jgi:hypothetical protein
VRGGEVERWRGGEAERWRGGEVEEGWRSGEGLGRLRRDTLTPGFTTSLQQHTHNVSPRLYLYGFIR